MIELAENTHGKCIESLGRCGAATPQRLFFCGAHCQAYRIQHKIHGLSCRCLVGNNTGIHFANLNEECSVSFAFMVLILLVTFILQHMDCCMTSNIKLNQTPLSI